MNVKTAKKPESRVGVSYSQQFKMQTYGEDNLYPQNLLAITSASGTAKLCLNRYAKFIEGFGFKDTNFSEYVLNKKGDTADTILHNACEDIARFKGFALHVNYNVFCQIVEVQHIPFENCRLEEEDENGYIGHILIHPDWKGKKTRNGKAIMVTKDSVKKICVFNPNPDVVLSQVEAAGGIDRYEGQVLWVSLDGPGVYPTPIYDPVVTEMSTDEGLSNVKNRNVRNNFLVSCMIIAKKGVPSFDKDGNEIDRKMIAPEDLKKFQGDTNGNKILLVELEDDEDKPEVVAFPTKSYDKDFTVTDESTVERIYAQFHQELFYSIRMGKLGFSGDVMRDAYEYYAGEVTIEQRFVERAFDTIFKHWYEVANLSFDFGLRSLKYIDSNETSINS
ncbi:MAG: hypothetical protein EGQ20_11350 [Bacteroides oleiciplenus]|nr:hypothetical protein [Bacteroides oleiciplenus]